MDEQALNVLARDDLNPVVTPSLKHIALFKIATMLWNQDDIMSFLLNYNSELSYYGYIELWRQIELRVIEKVPQLLVPKCLEEEVLRVIKSVRLHTAEWIHYHGQRCYFVVGQPNKICWTPYGTVDEKKTVEEYVRNETGDVVERYKLACVYCLEDDIPLLWCQIPEEQRKQFYCKKPSKIVQHELVKFWTYYIKGKIAKLDKVMKRKMGDICTPFQYAFQCAAEIGNTAATECFLQKLTTREREECILTCARSIADRSQEYVEEHCAQVLHVLLSEMTEDQKQDMYELYPYGVLKCFLHWPWQRFFMDTARRMWPVMSVYNFHFVLLKVIEKITNGYTDCNYQKLFADFWQECPMRIKKELISNEFYRYMHLFKVNKENTALLLDIATDLQKEKIIFSEEGKKICIRLMANENWCLLRFIILQCILSSEKLEDFIAELETFFFHPNLDYWCYSVESYGPKEPKWNQFLEMIDDVALEIEQNRECDGSPSKEQCIKE